MPLLIDGAVASTGQKATFTSADGFASATSGSHPLAKYLATGVAYDRIYERQLWPHVAITTLLDLQMQLPRKTYRREPRGRTDARSSPFGQLMARPSARYNPHVFWGWFTLQHWVQGKAFARKHRDNGGRPINLELIHPSRMRYGKPQGGHVPPSAAEQGVEVDGNRWWLRDGTAGNREIAIARRDFIYWPAWDPTSPELGMSRLEPLRDTLENEAGARRASLAMWRRGGRPSFVLTHPGNFDNPQTSANLATQFETKHGGVENWGRPLVLEENMKALPLQVDNNLQYIDERKLNANETAACFRIPPPAMGLLEHATYCLPATATISTLAGPRRIEDVAAGDEVYGFDGTALVPAKVTWSGQTGVLPTYRVKTANRTLEATANHPLLVMRRPFIGGTGNRRRYGDPEHTWVMVADLSPGDLLVAGHGHADVKGGELLAPTARVIDQEFMEFCGLLLGDGWIGSTSVAIAHAADARYIDHYLGAAQRLFRAHRGRSISLDAQDRCTRFGSVSAVRELTTLGFSGTAKTKRVPGWVFTCARDLRLALLRGFIEADGSVCKMGRIAIGLANEGLRDDIWELCIGLGVPVTNRRRVDRMVRLPNGKPFDSTMFWLNLTDPGANREIGSHDPIDLARLAAGKAFSINAYTYADRSGRTMAPPLGGQLSKVTSIKPTGETVPVFDLTVKGCHSFVVDGLVVHNSNVTEQNRSLYRTTMPPVLTGFEAMIEHDLRDGRFGESGQPDFGELFYFEWLIDGVMRGNFEERIGAYAQGIQSAQITPAEVRELENRPHIEGSDALFINAAVATVEDASGGAPADAKALAELVQKVYLGTPDKVVLSTDEARAILNRAGAGLTGPAPRLSSPPLGGPDRRAVDGPSRSKVMGRLSRQTTLDEVEVDRLIEGLDDLEAAAVKGAYDIAVHGNLGVAELRQIIKTIGVE